MAGRVHDSGLMGTSLRGSASFIPTGRFPVSLLPPSGHHLTRWWFPAMHQSERPDRFAETMFSTNGTDPWNDFLRHVAPRIFGGAWEGGLCGLCFEEWKAIARSALTVLKPVVGTGKAPSGADNRDARFAASVESFLCEVEKANPNTAEILKQHRVAWERLWSRLLVHVRAAPNAPGSVEVASRNLIDRISADARRLDHLLGRDGQANQVREWKELRRRIIKASSVRLSNVDPTSAEEAAEDCTQWVCLRMLENLPSFRFHASLDSYIEVSVRNAVTDFLRYRSRYVALDDAAGETRKEWSDTEALGIEYHQCDSEDAPPIASSARTADAPMMSCLVRALRRLAARGKHGQEARLAEALSGFVEQLADDDAYTDTFSEELLLSTATDRVFPGLSTGAKRVLVCRFRLALMREMVRVAVEDCLDSLSRLPGSGSVVGPLLSRLTATDRKSHMPERAGAATGTDDTMMRLRRVLLDVTDNGGLGVQWFRLVEGSADDGVRLSVALAGLLQELPSRQSTLENIVRIQLKGCSREEVERWKRAFMRHWVELQEALTALDAVADPVVERPPVGLRDAVITEVASFAGDLQSADSTFTRLWAAIARAESARRRAQRLLDQIEASAAEHVESVRPRRGFIRRRLGACLAEKGLYA